MITLQHSLVTLYALGGNEKEFDKQIPYVLLPDAIRKYCESRQYSHFEMSEDKKDASWFKYPSDIKNLTKEKTLEQPMYLVEGIRPCALGEHTSIKTFEEHNGHLSPEVYAGIKKHLTQDCIFDDFIREKIDCSKKYDDQYNFNGKEYNGEGIRAEITDMENHGLYLLAHMLHKRYGIKADQAWFDEHVKKNLEKAYPQDLAEATYNYMKIPEDINKKITAGDWSDINKCKVSVQDYRKMYKKVILEMPKIDEEKAAKENRSTIYETKEKQRTSNKKDRKSAPSFDD